MPTMTDTIAALCAALDAPGDTFCRKCWGAVVVEGPGAPEGPAYCSCPWRVGTRVLTAAQRDAELLPILADALGDAGDPRSEWLRHFTGCVPAAFNMPAGWGWERDHIVVGRLPVGYFVSGDVFSRLTRADSLDGPDFVRSYHTRSVAYLALAAALID